MDDDSNEIKLDLAPMIDVTFLLLIFFMCSIKFKQLEGKLDSYLPKDVGLQQTQVLEIQDEPIRVTLRVKGKETLLYVGSEKLYTLKIPRAPNGPGDEQALKVPLNLTQLQTKVGAIFRKAPELKCIIDPDERVPNMHVIAALDACLAAGISNINFSIPPKKKTAAGN